MQKPIVTIVYNTCVYVEKFRLRLIEAIQLGGYDVVVIAPTDEATPRLVDRGIIHYPISMLQYGMNPLDDLRSMRQIVKILRALKPVVSLHYTIKPNVFGTLAAHYVGVPVINNIAGAGRAFSDGSFLLRWTVIGLYRLALAKSLRVFFQNSDDMARFRDLGLVRESQCIRIPGSGVDLERYALTPLNDEPVRFLFIGRLLLAKGILEFLNAANALLATELSNVLRFDVVGEHELHRTYIAKSDLDRLTANERVNYLGAVPPECVQRMIKTSSCVVLPSFYGEGVPRVLLEACASGRPIITTDNVGCREVVEDGVNGFKVPVRDTSELIDAMRRFVQLPIEMRTALGIAARKTAENRFDEQLVIDAYLDALREIQ